MTLLRSTIASVILALSALSAMSPVHAEVVRLSGEALEAADRLLDAQNPKVMMADMVEKIAASLPAAVREDFVREMTSDELLARFRAKTRVVMAKHFSVEELNALTEFYSKPIAQSAMKKMGPYMADLMPFIQSEMMRISKRIREKAQRAQ